MRMPIAFQTKPEARISVVVLTQDVEDLIRECLMSATWADEIVVVDGGSRDRTLAICREFTDRIIERPWPGVSTMQWIAAIEAARGPWVLLLASDARVQPEGIAEIRAAVQSDAYAGYFLPLKNHFVGRWMQHCGWWPDHHILLFRKDRGSMETREHGEVKVDGAVGYLQVPILHFPHRSVAEYIRKTNRYTDAEARDGVLHERPFRRRFVITKAMKNVQKTYWKQHGDRDGMHGLVLCGLMAFYKCLLYAKYWERESGGAAQAGGTLSQQVDARNGETQRMAKTLLDHHGVVSLSVIRRRLLLGSLRSFVQAFLKRSGFRRGMSGLVHSLLAFWGHFFTWAKYWELTYVARLEYEQTPEERLLAVGAPQAGRG